MNPANELLELALKLSPQERASLARQLLLSLEPDNFEPAESYEALWNAEIEARMDRVEKGDFSASAWREAIERIRTSISQGPAA